MSKFEVPAHSPEQREILRIVEELRKGNFSPDSIYSSVCEMFPLMGDTDIHYLDLLLGSAHTGRKKVGDCIIADIRLCNGSEEEFCNSDSSVLGFNRYGRSQFSDNDMLASGREYMAAAIKMVNPLYGSSGISAQFDLALEVEGVEEPVYFEECEVGLDKYEYTHIEYFPMMEMGMVPALLELDRGSRKLYLRVYRRGTKEVVFGKEYDYVDIGKDIVMDLKLLDSNHGYGNRFNSNMFFCRGMNAVMELYIQTALDPERSGLGKIELSVRMDTCNDVIPKVVMLRYIDLVRYDDDLYMFMGNLFGELGRLEKNLFADGDYRVSFSFLGCELFAVHITCDEGNFDFSKASVDFEEANYLGWRCGRTGMDDMEKENELDWSEFKKDESENVPESDGEDESDTDEEDGEEAGEDDGFWSTDSFVDHFEAALEKFVREENGCSEGEPAAGEPAEEPEDAAQKGERNENGEQNDTGEEPHGKCAMERLESLIGLDSVKREVHSLRRQLELAMKRKEHGLPADMPFLHARFYGNPGTGKTTVAKLLGQIYKEAGLLSKGHVVFAERKTLIAGRWYDSVNSATMEAIEEAQGGILFIDEAYNLYVADDGKDPGQDVISTLLTVLSDDTKKDWMLIMAGYPLEMEKMMQMNPGFKSRVPNVFHFMDYDAGQLMQIAELYCKEHVYTLEEDARVQLQAVISREYAGRPKNFENARYVVNLFETVILKRMGERLTSIKNPDRKMLTTIIAEDIPSLSEVKESRKMQNFSQMVGLSELKESIRSHLNYVKLCNNRLRAGLSTRMPPLHMIFSGNPGTGKTTVADFIGEIYASMGILSEGNVIKVTKKELVGTWVGETERNMREILARARGNVLFIDEAYELNPKGNEKDYGKMVLDALVDELGGDNPATIVIMAGYPKEMEELLECNPGLKSRFPNVFHFKDYSVEELMKIALSGQAAKDFTFTPTAKKRLEAYIRREVLKKQKSFGNGRFVTRLITNVILPRMATRLSEIENPTVKQLQTVVADDIPITLEEMRSINGSGFDEKLINDSLERLDAMVGLPKVKQAIHNFVDVARYRNSIGEKFVGSGVLKWSFTGNTGTGKSTVAKIFTDILKGMNLLAKGNFVEVKGEQIFNVSEYSCDQVLKSAVDRSRYGMLFIDGDAPEFENREVYALTNEQLKIKLTSLTTEMGGAGAIIVAECSAKRQSLVASMNCNGIYEFDHTIVFDDYTSDELYRILDQCLAAHKVRFTEEASAKIVGYISDMLADKGPQMANARTMKLLSRTIYEIVMLRESRTAKGSAPSRTVLLCDVERFVWRSAKKRIGY